MKKITAFFRTRPAQILLIVFLCCFPGLCFLTRHGFYWDDWSQLFLHTKFGDSSFWQYFYYDRPFSAWTDILFFPLCGDSHVRWHLLFIGLKSVITLLFYLVLREILPQEPVLTLSAVLLFAVCPLFSQQYISLAYSQHYTDYVCFFLSIYTLLRAAKSKSTKKMILLYSVSILCMLLHLSISEFFALQELLKFPLLWLCLRNRDEKPLKKAVRLFILPFILFAVYCLFRLRISNFIPQYNANPPELLYRLQQSIPDGLRSFLRNCAVDMLYPFTGFAAKLFDWDLLHILSLRSLLQIIAALLCAGCVYTGLRNMQIEAHSTSNSQPAFFIILLALAGIFLGIAPFLVMDENVLTTNDASHADRCFIAAMPWVCLMFAIMICKLASGKDRRALLCACTAFFFAHALFTDFQSAVDETEKQNNLYRQLLQRIPEVEDGTAFVDDSIIFPEQGNFATASAINILYSNPIRENGDVPLWVFSYDTRLYENHGGFHVNMRNYHFQQSADDYIYIDHDNHFANCLWVFGPEDIDNPHISNLQKGWIANSALDRIHSNAEPLLKEDVFGTQENNWCFYYQNAALLRQTGSWDELNKLAETVLSEGYSPSETQSNSPFEWWPFIEGLYRAGNTGKAEALTQEALIVDSAYEDFFRNRIEQLRASE